MFLVSNKLNSIFVNRKHFTKENNLLTLKIILKNYSFSPQLLSKRTALISKVIPLIMACCMCPDPVSAVCVSAITQNRFGARPSTAIHPM